MEPSSSNERDQRINMTSMFDGDQTAPAKKERSRSNEVVKKLSFQLGCQSHDEDLHASKNASPILQEDGATEKLKPDDKAIIIDLNMNVMDNHIERIDVNDPGALISPVPRHHYNRNTISMHSTLKEKEEMDIENDMIYDSLRSRRRYQLWRGNNVFLCYGRLMLGVHIGHLTLSVALITGTSYITRSALCVFQLRTNIHV